MGRAYDFIVIDHPHVGHVTHEGCLLPFEGLGRDGELTALAHQAVGAFFESYRQGGHLWAVPRTAPRRSSPGAPIDFRERPETGRR